MIAWVLVRFGFRCLGFFCVGLCFSLFSVSYADGEVAEALSCDNNVASFQVDCAYQYLLDEDYSGAVEYLGEYEGNFKAEMLKLVIYSWPFTDKYDKALFQENFKRLTFSCVDDKQSMKGLGVADDRMDIECLSTTVKLDLLRAIMSHRFYLKESQEFGYGHLENSFFQFVRIIASEEFERFLLEAFTKHENDKHGINDRRAIYVIYAFLSGMYGAFFNEDKYCHKVVNSDKKFSSYFCDQHKYYRFYNDQVNSLDIHKANIYDDMKMFFSFAGKWVEKFELTIDKAGDFYISEGYFPWIDRALEQNSGDKDNEDFIEETKNMLKVSSNFGCDGLVNRNECVESRYRDLLCGYYLQFIEHAELREHLYIRCEEFLEKIS